MGEWLYRKALDHVCNKPSSVTGVNVGDIWKCDCNKMWQVKRIGYDQRDNGSWLEWEEFDGAVPKQKPQPTVSESWRSGGGIYAPGTR